MSWRFVSSIANPAGDDFSRKPPHRNEVKDNVDSKPETFGEAWQMARGSAASQADTDFVIRSSVISLSRPRLSLTFLALLAILLFGTLAEALPGTVFLTLTL